MARAREDRNRRAVGHVFKVMPLGSMVQSGSGATATAWEGGACTKGGGGVEVAAAVVGLGSTEEFSGMNLAPYLKEFGVSNPNLLRKIVAEPSKEALLDTALQSLLEGSG